jgi:hypothetical protein
MGLLVTALYSFVHETRRFRRSSVVWVKPWQQKETGFQVQLFNIALIRLPLVNLNIAAMDLLCWMEPKGTVAITVLCSARKHRPLPLSWHRLKSGVCRHTAFAWARTFLK